jgi:hypothetical protein
MGTVAVRAANIPVLGEKGSWTWTTSGRKDSNPRRMTERERGSGQMGTTDPLNGILMGLPTIRTFESGFALVPGAMTMTS